MLPALSPTTPTLTSKLKMRFLRRFSSSRISAAQFFARTSISPNHNSSLLAPTHFTPKSVVLLSTPQNLPFVIENAITFYQLVGMQVLVAGVDGVVPNGTRNGVSELWLDDYLTFGKSIELSKKDSTPPLRESDGIHVVGAKTHWKNIDAGLRLYFGDNSVDLSLANTAFSTNTLATLFFFQPKHLQEKTKDSNMGEMLCELTAALPNLEPQLSGPLSEDRWIRLTDEELRVTKFHGNLIKSINGKSAASFLEKSEKLMSFASKDTKVYVKLYNGDLCKKYEVIAGGGGWGAKADLLAISPEAKPQNGDRLEFFMVSPDDRYGEMTSAVVSNRIRFECIPEATSYGGEVPASQEVENLFGCGCESGFEVNEVNHRSAGEVVEFSWK